MQTYLWLKWLHIMSATLMFGTGLGTAFYKWSTDRSGNVQAVAVVMERVVLADWLFTTPAVILQPLTGIWMAHLAGWPLDHGWLFWALALYMLAGICWLPVLWQQIEMRNLACQAAQQGTVLPYRYTRLCRWWFGLGVLAFSALIAVYLLMVFKPSEF